MTGASAPPMPGALTAAQQRALAAIRAALSRVARYDDESIVHKNWLMQRYDSGRYATLGDARRATVATAWHEAGHAVAALTVGARFRSASIHAGRDTEGRVHGMQGTGDLAFVIDAAGQIAEQLDPPRRHRAARMAPHLAGRRRRRKAVPRVHPPPLQQRRVRRLAL